MLAKSGRRSPSRSANANVSPGPSEVAGVFPALARATTPPQTIAKNRNVIAKRNNKRGTTASRSLKLVGTQNSRAGLGTTRIISFWSLSFRGLKIPPVNPIGEREFTSALQYAEAASPRKDASRRANSWADV